MTDSATEKKHLAITPRQTEKAVLAENKSGVYVFNIPDIATKQSVAAAIREAYKVTPLKVNVSRTPSKRVWVRGKWGTKRGGKKAYVYLKKGDKITV